MLSRTPYPATALTHPKYRKDIDGLRAVAVLAVIFFHAFPDFAPGGFVGVDVFFVISGYLISTIILGSLSRNAFSFREFYARRIRRIFPALIVVLATCLLLGWLTLLADEYVQLGRHTVGGAAFVSNLLLWQEAGYFDADANLKPLLHLWSLGIEEQFYLAWPLALWLAWRKRFNALWLTLLVSLGSFGLNVALVHSDPVAAFYSPATRFWELMLGAVLAHATLFPSARLQILGRKAQTAFNRACDSLPDGIDRPTSADATSLLGVALIATTIFTLHKEQPFPGWWALLPTIGAFLLISSGPDAWCNRRILSSRAFVFIGVISYPLYLWHWPLLAFARISGSHAPSPAARAALVVLGFLLAWATYRLVEKPIRFGGKSRGKLVLASSALIAVGLAGLVIVRMDGIDTRFNEDMRTYANFKYDYKRDARVGSCWLSKDQAADAYANECVDRSDGSRPLMVVWGDSNAARLFPGLRAVASPHFRLAQFTRDSCFPIFQGHGNPNCVGGNAFILSEIQKLRPETVVLFGHWDAQVWTESAIVQWLIPTVHELKRIGVRNVIVIGPAPQWQQRLPKTLVALYRATGLRAPRRTTFGLKPGVTSLDAKMQAAVGSDKQAFYFSAWSAMCDGTGCLTRTGSNPDDLTSWDRGHLTTSGARYLAARLAAASNNFSPAVSGQTPPTATATIPANQRVPGAPRNPGCEFCAVPATVKRCEVGMGVRTTLFWDVTSKGVDQVVVYVVNDGVDHHFGKGPAKGSKLTGPWLKPGIQFKLKDLQGKDLEVLTIPGVDC